MSTHGHMNWQTHLFLAFACDCLSFCFCFVVCRVVSCAFVVWICVCVKKISCFYSYRCWIILPIPCSYVWSSFGCCCFFFNMNVEKLWPSHFRESMKCKRWNWHGSNEMTNGQKKNVARNKSENCGLAARLNYFRLKKRYFFWLGK